jgi:hypothetical protein
MQAVVIVVLFAKSGASGAKMLSHTHARARTRMCAHGGDSRFERHLRHSLAFAHCFRLVAQWRRLFDAPL